MQRVDQALERFDPKLRAVGDNMLSKAKRMPLSTSSINSHTESMEIIEHPKWGLVSSAIQKVSDKHPEWFPTGYAGIHAVANSKFFAATNAGAIYLSDADILIPGFRPASELASAVLKCQASVALSFTEEYAIETVWHELIHGMTLIQAVKPQIGKDALEEGLVQAVSRLSYQRLLVALGGKPVHQSKILRDGLAYPITARNVLTLLRAASMHEDALLDNLIQAKEAWKGALVDKLSMALNIQPARVRSLLSHAAEKDPRDFIQKLAVMQRNAPHNSLE
jgi:hypothetical protein